MVGAKQPRAARDPMDDLDRYRSFFPATRRYAYLNHAGVSPTSTRAHDAASAFLDDVLHHGGVNEDAWEEGAERARTSVASLIGATPGQIAFVRNTSHGLGLFAEGLDWSAGDEVLVAASAEYPSNVYPWIHLASRGVVVREIPCRSGVPTPDEIRSVLGPRARVLATSSIGYANGRAVDLGALGALCREHGLLFCVDGIQSVGAMPLDVASAGVDFLSADGHKWLLAPSGCGLCYVGDALVDRLRPVLVGWKSTTDAWNFDRAFFELRRDARKLEEGSPAYAGVHALGAAADLLLEVGLENVERRIHAHLAALTAGLAARGCDVSPEPSEQRTAITFVPPGGDVTSLAEELRRRHVVVSVRRGRIRVSPHFYNDANDLEALLDAL
jgi:cysteine desulfurase / selenocysteine lyase